VHIANGQSIGKKIGCLSVQRIGEKTKHYHQTVQYGLLHNINILVFPFLSIFGLL